MKRSHRAHQCEDEYLHEFFDISAGDVVVCTCERTWVRTDSWGWSVGAGLDETPVWRRERRRERKRRLATGLPHAHGNAPAFDEWSRRKAEARESRAARKSALGEESL